MGKTRDLFKKTGATKANFQAKMGKIKDRNDLIVKDLIEEIKKRWQEHEEVYKIALNDSDNHNGVDTHVKPDILQCEVKRALGSITMNKTSGGDGIPAELFQILKDDAVTALHSIDQQIWKTRQWIQGGKMSIFIPNPKKGNAKVCSKYCAIAFISHASKVMFKILYARLQQSVN